MVKNNCEFNEGDICQNDDMNSGEECEYANEADCPKTYRFPEEDY